MPEVRQVSRPGQQSVLSSRGHFGIDSAWKEARGVTLIELVMVMIITGIIAAVVAVFIQKPVQSYFDSTRRAELVDAADSAIKRMTRDLRLALPNSVRVDPGGNYLEFLITSGGGRYRADVDASGLGNPLTFGTAASPYRFDVIGPAPSATLNSDSIVVYNLGPGFLNADAYAASNNNRRLITGSSVAGGVTTFTISPATALVFDSPGKRFQVVQYAVTYQCAANSGNPAAGVMQRYWNYGISATQPTSFSTTNTARIAGNVSSCSFTYNPNVVAQREGVVIISLQLTKSQETVSLVGQAHVSNVP